MKKFLQRLAIGLAIAALPLYAIADYTATTGSGTTIFAFTCFTTKVCPAHTLVTSAGTEIIFNANGTASPANSAPVTLPTSNNNFVLEPAASDNHTVIINGSGHIVQGIVAFNNSATVNYGRLYNAGTGFNGCNSATNLAFEFQIPANTSVGGFVIPIANGLDVFSSGISICVTSGYGQTNTTAATATAMSINVMYR